MQNHLAFFTKNVTTCAAKTCFLQTRHPLQTCWSDTSGKLIASFLITSHHGKRFFSPFCKHISLFTTAFALQSRCILYKRCIPEKLFASFSATLHPLQTLFILCKHTASFRTILHALSTLYILYTHCAAFAVAARTLQALGILLLETLCCLDRHLHLIVLGFAAFASFINSQLFLRRIQQCSHLNQMPSEKLACVFSSCLFQTRGQTPQEASVVQDLISNYISLFNVSLELFEMLPEPPGRGLAIISLTRDTSCCVIGQIFSYLYRINSQQLNSTPVDFA